MKNRILLTVLAFLMMLTVSAQKTETDQSSVVPTASRPLVWDWSPLLGVDVVHFGQTTTHYTLPKPGHTYQFSAFHGLVTSSTATTVSVIWNVPPYSWGYVYMIETNENGGVRTTSHPVIIIPYN